MIPSEELYKYLEALYHGPISSSKAAVLKIALSLEAHSVWRRVVVPLNISFDRFHRVIQAAFGWRNYHLHEFFIYENAPSNSEYSSDAYDKNYCVCVEGEGSTPPEDVGGEGGYQRFLGLISNKDDPEHDRIMDWTEG